MLFAITCPLYESRSGISLVGQHNISFLEYLAHPYCLGGVISRYCAEIGPEVRGACSGWDFFFSPFYRDPGRVFYALLARWRQSCMCFCLEILLL